MSTTTPATETRTTTGDGTETRTDGTPRSGSTGTGRPDRWAAGTAPRDATRGASLTAPRTFDPSCGRRLRNCVDAANAGFPDGG